jgi:trimeric autotransporter adhesin
MKTITRFTLIATICCLTTTIFLQTLAPDTWRTIKEAISTTASSKTIKKQGAKVEQATETTYETLPSNTNAPSVLKPFLTFSPVAVTISASMTAAVTTDVAPTGASAGDVLEYTTVLSNTGSTDATGVTFTDVLSSDLTLVASSTTATPIAVNDSYTSIGNVGITVNAAGGVLANDVSPDNTALSVTGTLTGTTANGGTYTLAADGSFTYINFRGYTGVETFSYTLSSTNGLTTTASVSVTVTTPIWFINAAYAGGGNDGTLAKPFTSVNAFQAINNAANTNRGEVGDFIFVYSGSYTSTAITLLNSQKLIGQAATASIASITGITVPTYSNALPSTGGAATTLANTTATPITLGSANDVQGLTFTSTSGTTMTGSSVGALKVRDVTLSASAGQALQITTGGALDVQFKSISAASAAKGISVNSSTGSFQVLGTGTTAGSGGTIQSITTRGVEFSSCSNVTLKNMNFVNACTTAGTAFATTGISGSNGAIYCNSVNGVTLDNIQMNTTTGNVNVQNGINLNSVTTFSLANSTITRCGTDNEEACIMAVNTAGACSITNSTISKASRCVRFTNNSTNMTLKVTGSSFNDTRTFIDPITPNTPDTQLNPNGAAGILFEGFGTSVMSLDVKSACNFLRIATSGVESLASDNAVVSTDVQNCIFNATNANLTTGEDVGLGLHIQSGVSATVKFNVLNNTITGRGGDLINVGATGAGRMEGTIEGNTINYNFKSSINNNAGNGIGVVHASTNTTSRVKINNNTITNIAGSSGVSANVSGGSSGRADIICTNNTITLITTLYGTLTVSPVSYAFIIGSAATSTICSKVANNTSNAGTIGIARIRAATATDIHLVEGSGLGSDNINNLETIWNNFRTTGTIAASGQIVKSGVGTHTLSAVGTCANPSNPLLNLSIIAQEELPNNLSVKLPKDILALSDSVTTSPPSVIEPSGSSPEGILSGETVTVNGSGSGFTLPAGKNTTIKFRATVSATPTVCDLNNQATISGSNFSNVSTNTITLTVKTPQGNPSVFGTNVWNIYAWNAGGGAIASAGNWTTNYSGYYTNNNLNFNTTTDWNSLTSPSNAANYQGCPVGVDNHSWSAKRQGFPCSMYQLDIPTHDDAVQLWVNGTKVYENATNGSGHTNVWTGFLGTTDQVEFRVTEGTGGSEGQLTFTAISFPTTTTNNALNFDGTNDYVEIKNCSGAALDVLNAITIEYWFKGSNIQSAVRVQNGSGYIVAGWSTGLHIISSDGGTTGGLSVGATAMNGNWHHVAMTWQRNTTNGFKSYLDGQLVAQRTSLDVALPSINSGMYLGAYNGTSEFMNGTLDEVRVWNVARTQAQIQAGVNGCTFTLPQANLVVYYKFDHGSGGGANSAINTMVNSANTTTFPTALRNFTLSGASSNWMAVSCAVLPIELTSINVVAQPTSNLLTWTTASEVNTKGFHIERAPQPPKGALLTWESIGFVNAKGKAATYDFLDLAPPLGAGGAYYRVKGMDNDGKETLSKVVSITRKVEHTLKVYPNPVTNALTVETDNIGAYQVFNVLGQQILEGQKTALEVWGLDVSTLPKGAYFLKIGTEQVKFIKQ